MDKISPCPSSRSCPQYPFVIGGSCLKRGSTKAHCMLIAAHCILAVAQCILMAAQCILVAVSCMLIAAQCIMIKSNQTDEKDILL